jgi:putative hemolysin
MFQNNPAQLLVVVDEFGGTQGVVTLTDVMEAIVGDLQSEGSVPEPQVVERADGSFLIDGLLPLDDFKDRFELDEDLPGEADYQTIGGLVFAVLGRIPTEGETFTFGRLAFEVIDMDGNRVDKVLMREAEGEED